MVRLAISRWLNIMIIIIMLLVKKVTIVMLKGIRSQDHPKPDFVNINKISFTKKTFMIEKHEVNCLTKHTFGREEESIKKSLILFKMTFQKKYLCPPQ